MGLFNKLKGDEDFHPSGHPRCTCIWTAENRTKSAVMRTKEIDDPNCPKCHPAGAATLRRTRQSILRQEREETARRLRESDDRRKRDK